MRLYALIKPVALGLTALASAITLSNAQAAPITWNGWTFDYEVGVNKDGLALKNVSYNGHALIKRASLPMIWGRVLDTAGDNVCPEYQDKLDNVLAPMPWANNATLSQRQFTQDGRQWYEIGIYKLTPQWPGHRQR